MVGFEPNIDNKIKFLVLYLDTNLTTSTIARLLKVPLRTIQDWAKKTDDGKDIRKVKKGRGRKPSLDRAQAKRIIRDVRETPEKATTRRLAAKHDQSHSVIHRLLTDKGYQFKKVRREPNLNEEDAEDRINYCDFMLENHGERIYNTFFSDEMGIKLSEAYPSHVWTRGIGAPIKKSVDEDLKLNCWGAISINGATSLDIYEYNLDQHEYQRILEEHIPEMEEIFPDGFLFQDDNHPSHRAIRSWMEEKGLERVDFPSYSPDLTPIENLWHALKTSVQRDQPRSEQTLVRSLKTNWEILTTPENLRPYFEGLHTRYFECFEEKGQRLPY